MPSYTMAKYRRPRKLFIYNSKVYSFRIKLHPMNRELRIKMYARSHRVGKSVYTSMTERQRRALVEVLLPIRRPRKKMEFHYAIVFGRER